MVECNSCGSKNAFGMSRVVGYFSIIENWNGSKQAELVDRKRGVYKLGQIAPVQECIIVE